VIKYCSKQGKLMNTQARYNTDDVRIKELKELVSPASLIDELPVTDKMNC